MPPKVANPKPKPKYRRQTLLIIGGSFALVVVSASNASALLDTSNILNQAQQISPILDKAGVNIQPAINQANHYVQDANQYLNQISSFYEQLIAGNIQGILGSIQGITGALGIPDPSQIRTQGVWNEQIPGTQATAQAKANTTDRAISMAIASTVLGQLGQTFIRNQQQQVDATVQNTAVAAQQTIDAASNAQSRNVSQDILKDLTVQQAYISQQQAGLAQINQLLSTQLTGLQLQSAAGNLMLGNISGTLDQQELSQRLEQQASNLSEAQTVSQIYIPGINLAH